MLRRTILIGGAAAGLGARAQGAPRHFAVISEFGREISVVSFQGDTGTRLGSNTRYRMELPDGIFDKQALLHARRAIEKAEPGARTWLVAPLATDLFDPAAVFTVGGTVRFPDDLAAALKERGCTHVIAFTRLRADANLRAFNSRLGDGQLEGLGFYLDRVTPIKNVDSLVSGVGFVAPYFYVRASLLDAASGRVQAMQRITEGEAIGADTAAQAGDPWGSLPNSTKVQLLNNLVESQVLKAVPQLLAVR